MASRRKWVTGFGIIAVVAVLAGLATAGAGAGQQSSQALPRNATLYTSGTAWGPFTQFNPLRSSGNATGTLGLLYETLFRYDPLKDKYIPWLATSGKWVGTTYVVHFGPMKSPTEVLEVERPRLYSTKFGNWILRGRSSATFEPDAGGTRITQMFETVGLIPAISSWVFARGSYEGSFRGELEKFARIAEREAPPLPG